MFASESPPREGLQGDNSGVVAVTGRARNALLLPYNTSAHETLLKGLACPNIPLLKKL